MSANPTSLETNANDDSSGFNNGCCFIDYFYSMMNEFFLSKTQTFYQQKSSLMDKVLFKLFFVNKNFARLAKTLQQARTELAK